MNMKRVLSMLKTEYEKTLSQNRKKKKLSASQGAGRLLLLFFVTMLVFTFVSRALAAITVAKVTVANPQRDRLAYSLSGAGEIVPEAEKSLMVLPGYRIDEVYVKAGEEVEVGTVLYSYNLDDIQDQYTSIENEVKKLELLIAEERLRQDPTGQTSETAKISLKQARENLEVAKQKLEEAQKDYEDSKNSTREKLLEDKNKEYDEAIKNYTALLQSQAKQRMQSGRIVEDATAALEQTGELKTKIEQSIEHYKDAVVSKDQLTVHLAKEEVFEAYYGSAKDYEEHKATVYAKASAVSGEVIDLWNLQNHIELYEEYVYKYQEELQKLREDSDPTVNSEQNRKALYEKYRDGLNTYFSYLEMYERQLDLKEDMNGEKSGELRRLRKNDKRLKDYLTQYSTAILNSADTKAQEKLKNQLFDYMYSDKQKEMEQEVKKKTLALTRAEEDYELQEKEFESERKDLQAKKTELKKVIESIEEGTYDYEEALEGKKREVEAAEDAVRLAKQAVELHNVGESDDQSSRKISELILQSHGIDLEAKKQELEEVRVLLDDSGEVRSPEKGIVTFVGVEPGKRTSGEEMIRLGFGDYLFRAEFDRDAATNIEEGVIANIRMAGKKRMIEVEIENITMSENGMSEMTARMPEDEYRLGEKAEFKITTESEQFDQCIPIQALHQDNYGDYILATREQEDILGTLLVAERVNVTILDKGSRTVAIDGAISSKSQVIVDSNKNINAGDRVRIDD